jgi:GH15 family glucan-1,4-alpha-glucosidase
MKNSNFPDIRDLAIIGDRRTAALVTKSGAIVWYCPKRFDRPSLLAAILDPKRGGVWKFHSVDTKFANRRYLEDSGVLETTFTTPSGQLQVTDWMPLGENTPHGICRRFSPVPNEVAITLQPAPNYARRQADIQYIIQAVKIDECYYLYACHPLAIESEFIQFTIPQGESDFSR